MKKLLLTIIIVVFTVIGMSAQSFGAKAGLNIANVSGDIEDNNALAGLNIGVFVEFELSESVFLQPELLYSAQGFKEKSEGISVDFKTEYLNIPVMFKFAVADDFNLEAGPQVGFLLSAKILGIDMKDEMESVDFGANLGFSYDFTENVFAGARYYFGFTDLAKDNEGDPIKNSVFSFAVGYKF